MKITLHNIGPFQDLSIEIPDKGLVCLIGPSGTGKSSLLRSINWILTGEPKRDILCLTSKKGKAYGRLEYGDLTIYRQKRSDKLEVFKGKLHLEDAAAHNYLFNNFGSSNVVFASSYLVQKNSHPLLDLNANDRLELIQNLVWSQDNPNVYVDKIEERIKEVIVEHRVLTDELQDEAESLKRLSKSCKPVEGDIDTLKGELEELEDNIPELESELNKLNKLRGKLESIEDQLSGIKFWEGPDLETLRDSKKSLEEQLVISNKLKKITTIRKELDELPEIEIIGNLPEISKIRELERKLEVSRKLAKRLQIDYTPEGLEIAKTSAKMDMEYYKWEGTLDKIKKIESGLKPSKFTVMELENLKICRKLYKCPKCETSLKIEGEDLIVVPDLKPMRTEIDIERELKIAKKYMSDLEALETLKTGIPELKPPKWEKSDLQRILDLEYFSPPEISSETLEKLFKRRELVKKLENYGEVVNLEVPKDIGKQLENIERSINSAIKGEADKARKVTLEDSRDKLKGEISQYKDVEAKLKSERSKAKKLRTEIENLKKFAEVLELKEKFKVKKGRVKTLKSELRLLGSIKEKMVQVEYQRLEENVETISVIANESLGLLFDEPMEVQIDLYKEIKSTGVKKPNINLKFILNGLTSESSKVLSGGQLDRVSMSLLLAFSEISNVPWILIDEYLASLNSELRERVREIFRERAKEKLVIISSHNDDTGDYDYIIDMEKLEPLEDSDE